MSPTKSHTNNLLKVSVPSFVDDSALRERCKSAGDKEAE